MPMLFAIPFIGTVLKMIATAFEVISPVLKGIVEALVWYTKKLWEGFMDVIDNIATVMFVITIALVAHWNANKVATAKLEAKHKYEIRKLEQKYKSQKPQPKVVQPKPINDFFNFGW